MRDVLTKRLTALIVISLSVTLFPSFAAAQDFSDLFGDENHVHPFITVDTSWSDNLYETSGHTTSDMVLYTRPGVWLALPGADRQIVAVETASDSPGGSTLSRFIDNDTLRYQTYLLYSPEFENYIRHTEHNDINHKLEGYALYNTPGGLSLEILEQLVSSHDDIIEHQDNLNYTNNYLSPSVSFAPTEKLTFRLDYSLYNVNYERKANVKDRVDNSVSTYVFFQVLPKTSLFIQYAHLGINYDNTTDPKKSIDSTEQDYLLGVKWDITDKTTGSFKAGYQRKDFAGSEYGDTTSMKMELKGNYEISGHSSISLTGRNEFIETDEDNAYYIQSNNLLAVYEHSLSERLTGFFSFFYNNEDYGRLSRKDRTLDLSPSLSYIYNDWMSFNAAYTFESVRSTGAASAADYSKNTILMSVSMTM